MSDEFELSDDQRGKLINFVARFDQLHGDGGFDVKAEWSDAELLALALRAAEILGFEGEALERFFVKEFGVAGVTKGDLEPMLAVAMIADFEKRLRCAGGGKN